MKIVRLWAGVLVAIGLRSVTASAQDRATRDQHDIIVAAMEQLLGEIPAGGVINIRSFERFPLVDRPELLVRAIAAHTGRDALDVRPLLEACGDKDGCDIGVPAYIQLAQARITANSAEVTVSWVNGRSTRFGLRGGRSAVLRLTRRDNTWIVTERLPDEAFTTGPAKRKTERESPGSP